MFRMLLFSWNVVRTVLAAIRFQPFFQQVDGASEAIERRFLGREPNHALVAHPTRAFLDFLHVDNRSYSKETIGSRPPCRAIGSTTTNELRHVLRNVRKLTVLSREGQLWGLLFTGQRLKRVMPVPTGALFVEPAVWTVCTKLKRNWCPARYRVPFSVRHPIPVFDIRRYRRLGTVPLRG